MPFTCNLKEALVTPIAILPENGARATVPSALTSMLGIPDMSFTLNMEPELKESVIDSNWPADPSKDKDPIVLSKTFKVIGSLP